MAKKAVIILPSAVLQLKTDGALMMVVFVKNLRSSVFSQSSKSESKLKVRGRSMPAAVELSWPPSLARPLEKMRGSSANSRFPIFRNEPESGFRS